MTLIGLAKKRNGISLQKAGVCALYCFFVGMNLCTVISFCSSHGGMIWIRALGILFFYISDYLIGFSRLVGGPKEILGKWVWRFYPIGQLLLLLPI